MEGGPPSASRCHFGQLPDGVRQLCAHVARQRILDAHRVESPWAGSRELAARSVMINVLRAGHVSGGLVTAPGSGS
jgi:hypothetical protein